MKFKLYPWSVSAQMLPTSLLDSQREVQKYKTSTITTALRKLYLENRSIDSNNPNIKCYLHLCSVLKIAPDIRLQWKKLSIEEEGGTVTGNHRAFRLNGYSRAETKSAMQEVKSQRKHHETHTPLLRRTALTQANRSPQAILWKTVSNYYYNNEPFTPQTARMLLTNTIINAYDSTMREVFRKLVSKTHDFYVNEITYNVEYKESEPPMRINLFTTATQSSVRQIPASTIRRDGSCKTNKIFQFIPETMPENGYRCFIAERAIVDYSEEIELNSATGTYVILPEAKRWLCSHRPPRPNLLQYSTQPTPPTTSTLRNLETREHRMGIEIEFDTKYTKDTAIKADNGRPLTPPKVLDDFGWALASDSSVQGGELKSPMIYWNNTKQITSQIPQQITSFINAVAKGESCGGHFNYSSSNLPALQCFYIIISWGFLFPILYPARARNRYCSFHRIQDVGEHYQWLRLKRSCIEIRIFPGFWDINNIMWRAKLIQLLMETCGEPHMTGIYTNRSMFRPETTDTAAIENWNEFRLNECNPIRQHIANAIGQATLRRRTETAAFKSLINSTLMIPMDLLTPIEESNTQV